MAQREDPGSLLGPRPYGFAFTGLLLGAIFFAYAIKYHLSTVIVLPSTMLGGGARNGNGIGTGSKPNGSGLNRINGNGYHIDLGHHPLVSVNRAFAQRWILDSPSSSLVEATA